VNQSIEPIILVNVTSDSGLVLARAFHSAGRPVIGVISSVDKDFDKDISCLTELLVGEVEGLAKAACALNNYCCEVIHC